MFHGSIVALITPMNLRGEIDEASLRRLVDFHINAGTDAIVAVGTTGESPTLSAAEQIRVIRIVMEQARGRVPVIAGTGASSTAMAVAHTHAAMEAGVDACLIVTPYYNKPSQEGLYQHYKTIASTVAVPIILYNVPGRTAVDLLPETVQRLSRVTNIIGIKEATGKVERAREIMALCNESLDVYSGDDLTAFELMKIGAKGVISVTANVAPNLMHTMCQHALAGEILQAESINVKLMDLHKALFLEANPIPVKWAAYKLGLVPAGIRLPLTELDKKFHSSVSAAMEKAGCIKNPF